VGCTNAANRLFTDEFDLVTQDPTKGLQLGSRAQKLLVAYASVIRLASGPLRTSTLATVTSFFTTASVRG
jgi:hypothetical protein